MKNNWLQIMIKVYKIWSAVLFAVFLVIDGYRYRTFCLWQCSTVLMILLLLVDITNLLYKKRRQMRMDRQTQLLEQRLEGKK